MTPTEYEDLRRKMVGANKRLWLAGLELRAAVLRGEASAWGVYERSQAYGIMLARRDEMPRVQRYEADRDLWDDAARILRGLEDR